MHVRHNHQSRIGVDGLQNAGVPLRSHLLGFGLPNGFYFQRQLLSHPLPSINIARKLFANYQNMLSRSQIGFAVQILGHNGHAIRNRGNNRHPFRIRIVD